MTCLQFFSDVWLSDQLLFHLAGNGFSLGVMVFVDVGLLKVLPKVCNIVDVTKEILKNFAVYTLFLSYLDLAYSHLEQGS